MKVLNNLINQKWSWKIPSGVLALLLTFFFTAQLSSQVVYVIDPQCGTAFEDIDGAGDATCINLSDDGETGFTFFNFTYYNVIVNSATIGNNGAMVLGTTTGNVGLGSCFTIPANQVMPWWDDLDSDFPSNICYAERGVAPNRRLIVQWTNMCNFPGSANGPAVTFQAVFFEATNAIHFVYADAIFGGNAADNAAQSAVGISGPAGEPDYFFSCDQPNVFDDMCISFTPPPPPECEMALVDIVTDNDPGVCEANVTVPAPTFTGMDCDLTTLTNSYTGTANASGIYPIGVTEVIWSLLSVAGAPIADTMTVTVLNTEAIEMTCPDDVLLTLDPGDCYAYINFATPIAFSCNGFGAPPATLATVLGPNNGGGVGGQTFFDLTNNSGIDLTIVEMAAVFSNATTVEIYTRPGTYVGNTFSPAGWTLAYTANATTGPFAGPVVGQPVLTTFTTDFSIPPGVTGIAFRTPSAGQSYTNGTGANQFFSDGTLDISLGGAQNGPWAGLFSPRIWNGSVTYGTLENTTEATQTAGPASGEAFPIGTTSVCFEATDIAGNTAECCFDVTVNNFPDAIEFLVCNDLVNVSLGEDCTALITPDMLLEGGPYSCYEDYTVTLAYDMNFTNIIPNATLNGNHVGLTVFGRVENEDLSNSCWSQLFVEDKIPPVLECRDVTIECDDPLPVEPAPALVGYQDIIYTGLSDVVDNNEFDYEFDYSFLPVGTAVLDLNVRLKLNDHTWLPDLNVIVTAPDGTEGSIMTIGGCTGAEWPINLTFDDDGAVITQCIDLDADGAPIQPFAAGVSNPALIQVFEGLDASGVWNINISDNFAADDGTIEIVGMSIEVNLPQVVPYDACGPLDLTYSDNEIPMNCQTTPYVKLIERTWTAVDGSGNTTECVQNINVLKPDLATITLPPNYDGLDLPALLCDGAWDTNGNGYPDPAETGAPGLVCDEIVGTHQDLVIDICEGTYKILRNWTILDWCTGEIITHTQLIKVSDENGPEITCPEDFTVNTGYYDCGADVIIPAPVAIYDACSGASAGYTVTVDNGTVYWNGAYYILQDVVMDGCATDITVTYTASDDCGNEGTCEMIVTIRDEVPPVALCDQMTNVTLGADGTALVYWTSLDDGSYDNCGVDRIQVRRVETPPSKNVCGLRADIWRDYVKFCCDDLDENVMVEVGVWDNCNNFNSCWVTVFVESKLAPTIVPPPNITISCDFQFDLWDLSVFGEVETEQTLADGAVIDDIYTDDYEYFSKCLNGQGTNPIYWGQDGFAYGVCDVEVVENYNENLECGTGVITRVFKATSGSKSKTAVQKITIIDCDPFTENDIVWPRDYTSSSCYAVGPHHGPLPDDLPTVNGWPRYLDEDNCSLIAATFEDQVFQFVDSACWKVLRTWTVIDWCQYESNDPFTSGYWQYTQVIKLKNTVRPAFDPCEDMLVCTDNVQECTGYVELPSNVTDDCTPYESLEISWKVDAFADGTYDIFSTQPGMTYDDASGYYPFGTHRIFWNVEDMCGNTNTCSFLFTVEDCKQPTPYCYNGLAIVVMPAMGTVDVYARDFDVGSFDNCCANDDLVFRMIRSAENPNNVLPAEDNNPATPYPAGMTLTCDDVADVSTVVQIWVGDCGKDRNLNGVIEDNERNWDYCETYILAQDPNDVCPDTNGISGIIEAIELSTGIENATVMIENTQSGLPPYLTTATDAQGSYHATGLPIGEDAIITTEKNDDYLNGVNVLDLVLIQQHILGLAELNSNEKLIAADANNSNSISALDIIDLRKLILGIYDELPGNDSWVFPGNNVEMTIANGMYTQDFGGIKIGDVNETVQPSSLYVTEDRTNGTLTFSIDEMSVVAGEEYAIAVNGANFNDILGYQFTFGLNGLELINVEGGTIDMGADNFGTHRMNEGLVSTVWNSFEPVSANDVLFTLNVVATQSGQISSMINANSRITTEGAYSQSNGALGIEIQFNNAANADYALYQNTPNPFNESTKVSFTMAAAADATLTVYDVTGKVLVVRELDAKKGYNEVSFTSEDLNAVGVLYYQLDTDDFSATKKMIKLQ